MAYYIYIDNKSQLFHKFLEYQNELYVINNDISFDHINLINERDIFRYIPRKTYKHYTDLALVKIDPHHIISEKEWGVSTDSFVIEKIYQLSDWKTFQMLLGDIPEIKTDTNNIHYLVKWACEMDYVEVIKLLDEMGFDLTFEIDQKITRYIYNDRFIHYTDIAGYYQSYNVMEYLIDLGIKISKSTIQPMISYPNLNNFVKKIIMTIDDTSQYNYLMCVAASSNLDIFQYLVDLGADLSYNKYCIFIDISRHNNLDFVKYIFDRIDVQDFLNVEQFHKHIFGKICRHCNIEIIQYFIDIGINVNDYDFIINSMLFNHNYFEKMKYIMNAGYYNESDIIRSLGLAVRNSETIDKIEYLLSLCPNPESAYPVILQEAINGKSVK